MSGNAFRRSGGESIAVLGVDDHHAEPHARCFADEVVIDFPSMAPAIDRICTSFLKTEQQPEPLCAALRLSPREAMEGARVPLDVPVRCTCRGCGGRGETWSERCAGCAGTGAQWLRHQVQVAVPAGVTDGARFSFSVAPRHDTPTRIELHVLVR